MGKYRLATLLPAETATTAGTKTIDLDVNDPISMLNLQFKATSAGTAQTAHPAGNVTKIEVVDGSEIIASLTGKEAQALEFYNTGKMPNNYLSDYVSISHWASMSLRFGRKLWDPVLALDPTKFKNPQLKITHNYRTADAAASAATLEVHAYMFDEKRITPVGYLRPTEHYSYTCAANGSIETIDLPRDLPVRQMIVHASGGGNYVHSVAHAIKLKENGGAKIPFDQHTSAYAKLVKAMYGRVEEIGEIAVKTAGRVCYPAASFQCSVAVTPIATGATIAVNAADPGIPLTLTSSADVTCGVYFTGFLPHHGIVIPFGDQDDMNDWYDVGALSSLKMEIEAGSAGTSGAVQVVVEQLKRY